MAESENAPHDHDASCGKAGLHNHGVTAGAAWTSGNGFMLSYRNESSKKNFTVEDSGEHEHKITIASSGEGKPHNNMQPYDVIYRWRRTA